MKTTVELPEKLYREVKARAALRGQSIKGFLLEAVEAKLQEQCPPTKLSGWRAAFGSVPAKDVAEVQKIIDEEFSRIDPEDWH